MSTEGFLSDSRIEKSLTDAEYWGLVVVSTVAPSISA